jgi:hypothetical protein
MDPLDAPPRVHETKSETRRHRNRPHIAVRIFFGLFISALIVILIELLLQEVKSWSTILIAVFGIGNMLYVRLMWKDWFPKSI